MSDLPQHVEHGFQDPDGTYQWVRGHRYPVLASNRRRLLDSGRLHASDGIDRSEGGKAATDA